MTRPRSPAGCAPRGLLLVLAVGAVLGMGGQAAGAAEGKGEAVLERAAEGEWEAVLERAAEAARSTPYQGEALVVSRVGDRSSVTRVQVRSPAADRLVVAGGEEWRLSLDADGGALLLGADGWAVPLPAVEAELLEEDLRRLEEKYDVAITEEASVMGRPCTTVEITRQADGALRERLWVDDDSGLVVRRERFEEGRDPVRLATYLSLDLNPASVRRAAREQRATTPHEPAPPVLHEVGGRELSALKEAGWEVPGGLPGGYDPVGVYAVDAVASQPLQVVYSDGLYVVSVFQQRGQLDGGSLPSGAEPVEGLPFRAYEWPGAVPQRLVWQSGDRTWSLVGEAPRDEVLALVTALPRPAPPGFLERLRRGLGRLWGWMTP